MTTPLKSLLNYGAENIIGPHFGEGEINPAFGSEAPPTEQPELAAKSPLDADAHDQLNDAWLQMKDLPDGPKKEKMRGAIMRVAGALARKYDVPIQPNGPVDAILGLGLHAANYGAGLVQAPILAGIAAGGGQTDYAKEILSTALNPVTSRPQATLKEVLTRQGVPQGPSLSEALPVYAKPGSEHPWWQPETGGRLDPTVLGGASTAFDMLASPAAIAKLKGALNPAKIPATAREARLMAQDAYTESIKPQTIVDKLRNALPVALDPVGEGFSRAGRRMYDTAFDDLDALATQTGGRQPVSDVAFRNNIWGTQRTISRDLDNVAARLRRERRDLLHEAAGTPAGAAGELSYPREDLLIGAEAERMAPQKPSSPVTKKVYKEIEGELEDAYGPYRPSKLEASSAADEELLKKQLRNRKVKDYAPGDPRIDSHVQGAMADFYGHNQFSMDELARITDDYATRAAAHGEYKDMPIKPGKAARAGENAIVTREKGAVYGDVADRARRGLEDLGDTAREGLGRDIYRKNKDMSSIIASREAGRKAARGPWQDRVFDAAGKMTAAAAATAIPAYAMSHGSGAVAAATALMAALATSDAGRTGAGLALAKSAPWAGNAVRSYLNNKYSTKLRLGRSPWAWGNTE